LPQRIAIVTKCDDRGDGAALRISALDTPKASIWKVAAVLECLQAVLKSHAGATRLQRGQLPPARRSAPIPGGRSRLIRAVGRPRQATASPKIALAAGAANRVPPMRELNVRFGYGLNVRKWRKVDARVTY